MALQPGYYVILDRGLNEPETLIGPYATETHATDKSDWLVGSSRGEKMLLDSNVENVVVRHTDTFPKHLCQELTSWHGSTKH